MAEHTTDVFISGAGPVGLIIAYQLNRHGISTYIIDSADKSSPEFPMYGRACTLFARTNEMLDQLDLYDDLAQEGLSSDRSFTYQHGKKVYRPSWQSTKSNIDSFFLQPLNLRLKFSEDVFREKLAEMGTYVHAPLKLVDFTVNENEPGEHKVLATCQTTSGESVKVKAKYIVGADGGSSMVRKVGGIPFEGASKNQHWVRIDGVVKTNLPEARSGFGTIETDGYGQVLFVALDHGATRIGFALNQELFEKYGYKMTQEEAILEAKKSVAPFELEFEQLDWHTVYGIQQRVAERLVDRDRVILAGDAAHTHSSGTAQGMNTGMHDAVNLGWKLAGVMKGWYYKPVLQNYSDERRAVAQQLIENDKIISMLISGERPESMKDRREDNAQLFGEFTTSIGGFTDGLGISYPSNLLNDLERTNPSIFFLPGTRAPDSILQKPGHRAQGQVRLHEVTKYNGKFRVLVFAGKPAKTNAYLRDLREQVNREALRFTHAVEFVTIIEGIGRAIDEELGVRKFGRGYWDPTCSTHWTYGAEENLGAVVVIRPDGIIGASALLDGFAETIVPYFEKLIIPQAVQKVVTNGHADIGELINFNENNLTTSRKNAEMLA